MIVPSPAIGSPALEGRVALITGAATGLGFGIGRTLAAHGARLVLNDIDGERLRAAARDLIDADVAALVVADVSDPVAVAGLIAEAERVAGRLDILVNNAGVMASKSLVDHTVEDWDRVMAVNLRAPFLTLRAAVPGMIRSGSGAIVNIASISARCAGLPHAAYSASKAGLVSLTREAALELGPHGIRVNGVSPGPNATPMNEYIDPDVVAAIRGAIPLRRWGSPSDIGAAVAFLVSDAAAFVTGAILPVGGGADIQAAYAHVAAQV